MTTGTANLSVRLSSDSVEYWEGNLIWNLRHWAEVYPRHEAYVFRRPPGSPDWERLTVTFQELDRNSSVLAAWLLHMGIAPGDRIMVAGDNCPGWLYLDYACMKVKALLVRVPGDLQSIESMLDLLKKHRCKMIFVNPGENENVLEQLKTRIPLVIQSLQEGTDSELVHFVVSLTTETSFKLQQLTQILEFKPSDVDMDRVDAIMNEITPTDLAASFCTSGSTGLPQTVLYTHRSVVSMYRMIFCKEDMVKGTSRYFNDRKFSWSGSLVHTPVVFGVTNVYVDPKYTMVLKEYDFVFDVLTEERVSHTTLLPYMLYDIAQQVRGRPTGALSSLRSVFTCGERLSEDLRREILHIIPKLEMVYGSTECLPVARWNLYEGEAYGEVCHGVDLQIAENGTAVPLGDIGEIWVRGCNMFHGYLDDPEQASSLISADGWFQMGDVGRMDSRGRIQIVGRKSDVISRGTRKIHPVTVENLLKRLPCVAQCAVVGVPDPRVFEEICAYVVPVPGCNITAGDIIKQAKTHLLGSRGTACVPKYVVVADTLPMGSTGKVDRKAIKAMAIQMYDTGSEYR